MSEDLMLKYIRQRMREKGYRDFHWKSAIVSVKANLLKFISAYNEYYFLMSGGIAEGTLICGDTDIELAQGNPELKLGEMKEFTGNIIIDAPQDTTIEFIRVIPQL